MTRQEHLLTIAAEECAEVAHRISKELRFGRDEIQPGQPHTNRDQIEIELAQLLGVLEMVGIDDVTLTSQWFRNCMQEKRSKVEHFLRYSVKCGTLTASESAGEQGGKG